MKYLLSLFLCFSLYAKGQESAGIKFEDKLSWEQVLNKAKTEHKYIFVDCYATWCGPCKKMDVEVYPLESVGRYMNNHFISVKVQMDSTGKDNDVVQSWRQEARRFTQQYKVNAYPSYLFFSHEGKLVHKETAFKDSAQFMNIVKDALDGKKQYYTLIAAYQRGERDYTTMGGLVDFLTLERDKEALPKIALDYIDHYLLNSADLYTSKNLELIAHHLYPDDQRAIDLFWKHPAKVDSVVQSKGYANRVMDNMINKHIIQTELLRAGDHPDWPALNKVIAKKYSSDFADRTILRAQINWFKAKKQWVNLANARITNFKKYGMDTKAILATGFINNICWDEFFLHITDKQMLKEAIAWMEIVVKQEPVDEDKPTLDRAIKLDTYANLLYKYGQIKDAIRLEEKAALFFPKEESFRSNLDKMKKGLPTWPVLADDSNKK